jgi:hypothetical protein
MGNTSDPGLYQSCRWGNFAYNFPVSNGTYTVTLKFAEVAFGSPGQRQFNVFLNGSQVLSNFDIVAQAGGPYIATDRSFTTSVTNGTLSIAFTAGAADYPLINAIQVTPGQTSSAPTPTPTPSSSLPAVLINAGGSTYTDPSGLTWSGDYGFSASPTCYIPAGIANTNAVPVYQSCRWGSFGYTLSVPNGNYNVTLKFAELAFGSPGQRLFNVFINGSQVLSDFDIVAQAGGPYIALDRSFPVYVGNGQITIQFTPGAADQPMVNGIQITPQ